MPPQNLRRRSIGSEIDDDVLLRPKWSFWSFQRNGTKMTFTSDKKYV
jgi:hypothetical protein